MAHFVNGAPEIAAVEQDDRCGDEVEGSRAGLLVLQATIAKAAESMEGDRPRQTVTRLALVQFGGDRAAQSGIVETAQREQRAIDPPNLAPRRSEAVLLAAGGQRSEKRPVGKGCDHKGRHPR